MNQDEIITAINDILAKGYYPEDVETSYEFLISAGQEAISPIVFALKRCADGHGEGRWWDGADKLCSVLSSSKAENGKQALLTILNTDSKIVEFDRVRRFAAEELANFKDAKIIPDLLTAAKRPHAPILSIKKTIEYLGGKMPLDPQTILAEVSHMEYRKRIDHFREFHDMVKGWSAVERSAYYYWIGIGVENSGERKAALSFYAASVKANPSPDAAAWSRGFRNVPKTPKMAKSLARENPLPKDIVKTKKGDSSEREIGKRWWEFWKR